MLSMKARIRHWSKWLLCDALIDVADHICHGTIFENHGQRALVIGQPTHQKGSNQTVRTHTTTQSVT